MADYLADAAFIYKREYTDDKLGEHTERDHVLFQMMAKKRGMGGEDFRYPIITGNPQSVSGSFVNAQSQSDTAPLVGDQWAAQPVLKYGVVRMDGPSIQSAASNKGAFYDLVTRVTDGVLEEMGDSHGFDLYRQGNGQRGQRASLAGDVITLTDADDVRYFKINMVIIASVNADGSAPKAGTAKVVAVDEDAGTVTLDNAAGITGFADNDFLFRQGDPGTCVDGLESLFPLASPTSALFRGVDRTRDVRRLAGSRVDDPASYPEEVIQLLATKISNNGKRANYATVNPITHNGITKRLNAKVEYEAGGYADVYFQYIAIHTSTGIVKLYSDPDCPTDRLWVGSIDWLYYRHLGETFVHMIRDDGKSALRVGDADAIEARARSHANTIHALPGVWGIGSVA